MKSLITLTTDLGDQLAAIQMKAVLLSDGFNGRLIENHSVTPFSIVEGAFEISVAAQFTPPGSIHVGVVDPGVGSERRGIVVKTRKCWFVGPDNGLLFYAAKLAGLEKAFRLNESFWGNVSSTFHGRDVFIRSAVRLACGDDPSRFGGEVIPVELLVPLEFKPGQVLHIDRYGNIKVYWNQAIESRGALRIDFRGRRHIVPVVRTFSDVPPRRTLALRGSNGMLELAVNLGSGEEFFGVKVGDVLAVTRFS